MNKGQERIISALIAPLINSDGSTLPKELRPILAEHYTAKKATFSEEILERMEKAAELEGKLPKKL